MRLSNTGCRNVYGKSCPTTRGIRRTQTREREGGKINYYT